ncbi:DUF190 domain-containing protein [Accumulibacter sp.]|uniref:DUF190 domain-containing protein n=1 Tax=Accumulibacter sp. TaxID=2053492 RepID=UPI0025F4BE0D|nr:DUF190 domain-containing protein [Accumulibacter sp.]MCM8596583.1 DUF190 domain-containing protein [Accumulibacter sp.]MCM8624572.1 DUF190 domain-containing protein [Accumulibacter sp.]MDS4050731.1 DUF190 domain-containing protein [Accumulibacter sp.]
MEGSFVRFYVRESERHRGVLLWEWLLRQGNGLGLRGGSAFRSIGGFGRHHAVHEQRFFELAGSGAIEVEFVVGSEEEERLFSLLRAERLGLFYTRIPASFGVVTPDRVEGPTTTGAP